ncbi:MAG: hypothetical protein ACE5EC_05815, partial [Phycisphaerae bacterium]
RQDVKKPAHEVFRVRIDRDRQAAPALPRSDDRPGHRLLPRRLSFEVVGFSRRPGRGASQEARAAARQAAIVDAFARALIETRRSRGQSDSNFTAKLGRRLSVIHRTLDTGYEVEVRLIAGGVEKKFIVRNGVLQHLPHDFKLIHRMFAETRGEFSLLPTPPETGSDVQVAKVGSYLPGGFNGALAGDVDGPHRDPIIP